jgi:large subunit ribosomal protein L25
MAQQVKLKARKRTLVGRNAIKQIKAKGLVPGVIYGSNQTPMPLEVDNRELSTVLSRASSEHILVELEILDGDQSTNKLALIQEVQHHPLRPILVHVDFHAVSATEKITSSVPIETTGEALGVRTFGGLLEHSLRTLEVQCFPQDLPGVLRIDVTNLNIGESLHVRDIQLPAGVESITDQELTVVSVVASRVGEETAETVVAEAATPEVITEKKAEAKAEGAQP